MRIVAGEFSSRKVDAPAGKATRPTLDKVREAVFSSLGGSFEQGIVLDLYAGSGAVGLEALSRGMEHAYFADVSKEAVRVIKSNIETLRVQDRADVLPISARRMLAVLKEKGVQLDLVYLDPPYEKQENEKIIQLLQELDLLKADCRIVVESLKEDVFMEQIGAWKRYKEAVYGISKISYYRRVDTLE